MNILIAVDKFKGSLSSMEAAMAIKAGFDSAGKSFHCSCLPVSDGGEGLREAMKYYTDASECEAHVHDPLFRPIDCTYLMSRDGETAFIEMAAASGLALLRPHEYNCMVTSTYGTGELLREVITRGVKEIVLGIGGSATNDGGLGMAAALGYRFLDKNGNSLEPVGANLIKVEAIDTTAAIDLGSVQVKVACDVSNFLTGPEGAALVYAPQKGATPEMVRDLEEGMFHFAQIVERDLGVNVMNIPGGGAAGGMGAGCVAFLKAALLPGMGLLFAYSDMDRRIQTADLVITGEGKIDQQTRHGKVVAAVAQKAFDYGKTAIAFCGVLDLSIAELESLHLTKVYPIKTGNMTMHYAVENARRLLTKAACEAVTELGL